jgi:hypothetical protein
LKFRFLPVVFLRNIQLKSLLPSSVSFFFPSHVLVFLTGGLLAGSVLHEPFCQTTQVPMLQATVPA